MGYQGQRTKEKVFSYGRILEIIKRPRKWFRCPQDVDQEKYIEKNKLYLLTGFQLLPKRWIVERTLAWFGRYRRLSKDYEYCCLTSEAFLFTAMMRNILKRMTK